MKEWLLINFNSMKINFYRFWGVLIMVLIWYGLKLAFLNESVFFPHFHEVLKRLYVLILEGILITDIYHTSINFAGGFFISLLIGYPLGLFMGYSPRVYYLFEIPVEFIRSTPATILYPIFLAFLGLNYKTTLAMIFSASVMLITLNTAYSVFYINPIRKKAFELLKPNLMQTIYWLVIPESLPALFLSARLAISLSLIVGIVSELFIGSAYGLGARVMISYETLQVTDTFAVILVVGTFGYLLNQIFRFAERKVVHWVQFQKI